MQARLVATWAALLIVTAAALTGSTAATPSHDEAGATPSGTKAVQRGAHGVAAPLTGEVLVDLRRLDGASAALLATARLLPGGYAVLDATPETAADVAAALSTSGLPAAALTARVREAKNLNDPLLAEQWHLDNTGQSGGVAGVDVHAFEAWQVATGAGVTVSIVDDGVQYAHPDLAPNYDASVSRNYCDGPFDDPAPRAASDSHGTHVAGLAAARGDNALGVAGVAYQATLAAQRLIACGVSDADEAMALGSFLQEIDVVSNSWGPAGNVFNTEGPGPAAQAAIAAGATTGRDGKGLVYLWAAGNDDFVPTGVFTFASDSAAYDGYANNRYAIAVGAVSDDGDSSLYSEDCTCLFISAPSNDFESAGIVTTDRTGSAGDDTHDYTCLDGAETCFGGTSAATPIVAGVVALLLEANPDLTWRDVHAILASTANRTKLDAGFFATNAAGVKWSKFYGFGLVDAAAAVAAASNWTLLAPEVRLTGRVTTDLPVPDGVDAFPGPGPAVTQSIAITDDIILERAELILNATHTWENDLRVTLTSPSGTVSEILPGRDADAGEDFDAWRVSSVQFWGEATAGTWTLTVRDMAENDVGQIDDWTLNLFGHSTQPPLHHVYDTHTGPLPNDQNNLGFDCALNIGEVFAGINDYLADPPTHDISLVFQAINAYLVSPPVGPYDSGQAQFAAYTACPAP